MTHDFACRYEKIRAFAEKFLADGGLSPVISKKYIIVPGLCDVHVHFREPGFSYKETIGDDNAIHGRGAVSRPGDSYGRRNADSPGYAERGIQQGEGTPGQRP